MLIWPTHEKIRRRNLSFETRPTPCSKIADINCDRLCYGTSLDASSGSICFQVSAVRMSYISGLAALVEEKLKETEPGFKVSEHAVATTFVCKKCFMSLEAFQNFISYIPWRSVVDLLCLENPSFLHCTSVSNVCRNALAQYRKQKQPQTLVEWESAHCDHYTATSLVIAGF